MDWPVNCRKDQTIRGDSRQRDPGHIQRMSLEVCDGSETDELCSTST
jgi:hypothetical protein